MKPVKKVVEDQTLRKNKKFSQREPGTLGDMKTKVGVKAETLNITFFISIQMFPLLLLRIPYGFLLLAL